MLLQGRGVLREEEGEGSAGGQPGLFENKEEPGRLAKLEEKLDQQGKRLEEQSGFLARFFQQPQQPRQPQPNPDEQRRRFEEQFFQNPAGMTAQIAAQQAAQIAGQQAAQVRAEMYPMQVRSAREDARSKDPEVWDDYKGEIENWVRTTYDPGHHGNPFVWEQALNAIRGSKLDEIAAKKAERKKAAAAIEGPSRRGYRPEEQKGLTDDEKTAAEILGLSESDYEAAKKGYAIDRTAAATGRKMIDSDWSNVITLDHRKPRKRANA